MVSQEYDAVHSLTGKKICAAFGITLSQPFAEGDVPVALTDSQRRLLERWSRLSEEQQTVVFALIDKM